MATFVTFSHQHDLQSFSSSLHLSVLQDLSVVLTHLFVDRCLSHRYSLSPSIETHLAVVRGLPTKKFLPECINEKSSTERRS